MDFIKSQNISEKLTHILNKKEDYDSIQKTGIKITTHEHYMLWKPEAFWISMEYDWEKWCHVEDFVNVSESVICDVTLKKDLRLLKVATIDDAENLARLLMPDIQPGDIFEHMYFKGLRFGKDARLADMITLSQYQMNNMKNGKIIGPEFWNPITENYDGIYYLNSGSLHFDTFFNTWDAHCIALFDGKNAILSNPRSGKEIMDEIKKDFSDE